MLQGTEVTVTPSSLADQIPLCNCYTKRQYDIQNSFKDFVILPSRSVRSPGFTSRELPAITVHLAVFPRTIASCTSRVSVEVVGDVQFRIPTPNAHCWALSQCTSSAYSLLSARCSSGDWVSKLLIHFISDSCCSNPKRELWSPSPERDQGCSPVPSWRWIVLALPSTVSVTHTGILGGRIRSFCTSQPGSDPLSLSKNQALLCQAVKALYNIAAAQEPSHISTSARKMPRQALIPQPLVEPTHPDPLSPERPLPHPGAHSRCSALPSAVSLALPSPLPFPLRHLPGVMSAALPPQPPQHTPPATQPPIAPFPLPFSTVATATGEGIPSSGPPPPRALLGITHCSSS